MVLGLTLEVVGGGFGSAMAIAMVREREERSLVARVLERRKQNRCCKKIGF